MSACSFEKPEYDGFQVGIPEVIITLQQISQCRKKYHPDLPHCNNTLNFSPSLWCSHLNLCYCF